MYIYYDSKTGNVERFINKLKKNKENWNFQKICSEIKIENEGHLITYTTKIGEIPETTLQFLENNENFKKVKSVSSSGNMNWGVFFAKSANEINKIYKIPIGIKFELSGTQNQVDDYIKYVEEICNDGK